MAESHDLLAMDSYWKTLRLTILGAANRLYLVLLLESSRLEVGDVQFPLLTAPLSWLVSRGQPVFCSRRSRFTLTGRKRSGD